MITEVKKGCEIQQYDRAWWGLYTIVGIINTARINIPFKALQDAGRGLCESLSEASTIMAKFAFVIMEEQKNQATIGLCRTYGIPGMTI